MLQLKRTTRGPGSLLQSQHLGGRDKRRVTPSQPDLHMEATLEKNVSVASGLSTRNFIQGVITKISILLPQRREVKKRKRERGGGRERGGERGEREREEREEREREGEGREERGRGGREGGKQEHMEKEGEKMGERRDRGDKKGGE